MLIIHAFAVLVPRLWSTLPLIRSADLVAAFESYLKTYFIFSSLWSQVCWGREPAAVVGNRPQTYGLKERVCVALRCHPRVGDGLLLTGVALGPCGEWLGAEVVLPSGLVVSAATAEGSP